MSESATEAVPDLCRSPDKSHQLFRCDAPVQLSLFLFMVYNPGTLPIIFSTSLKSPAAVARALSENGFTGLPVFNHGPETDPNIRIVLKEALMYLTITFAAIGAAAFLLPIRLAT